MTSLTKNILRHVPDEILFPFLQHLISHLERDYCSSWDRIKILELLTEFTMLCVGEKYTTDEMELLEEWS